MNLSFIIPVYNVEKFVSKAILSVIANDWRNYTYEVILVDDESPDNSINIIKNIILENPQQNIKIISQKNKGLGGARNTGLLSAKGKHVFFLDSDDYLIKNKFPVFLDLIYKHNLDIFEFAAFKVNSEDQVVEKIFLNSTDEKVLSGEQFISQIAFTNSVCNKIYSRNMLLSNEIYFIEKVYIEDAPFNTEVFAKAHRVLAVKEVGVAYLQNPSSITRSDRSASRLLKFIDDSILIITRIAVLENAYMSDKAKKKVRQKVAYLTANTIWMITFGKGISIQTKKQLFTKLKNSGIFPYYHSTGSLRRNIFLLVFNILKSLRII